MSDNANKMGTDMFPSPLEDMEGSNSYYNDTHSRAVEFPYPREDYGGSNKAPCHRQWSSSICFRTLARFRGANARLRRH